MTVPRILRLWLMGACVCFGEGPAARLEVGPNILVSRESVFPKAELMLAANPRNLKNLVGTAIAGTPTSEQCMIYTSLDGGNSWTTIEPPGMPAGGSGDPE